jgi:hypothetical protein
MESHLPASETDLNASRLTVSNAGKELSTVPGWMCTAIGVGFIAFLVLAIVGARMFGS